VYLLDQNRLDEAGAAAHGLLAASRAEDRALLLRLCDRMLAENRADSALEIWNALIRARHVTGELLAPAAGISLTNGTFADEPSAHGFDWRLLTVTGLYADRGEHPSGIRFSFSGRQPEECDLLEQWLPVLENRRYRLAFESTVRLTSAPAASGLTWRVLDTGRAVILASSASLPPGEAHGELAFTAGVRGRLVRLLLHYARPAGSPRLEGIAAIRSVRLTLTAVNAELLSRK
jgi:hypothetical protein